MDPSIIIEKRTKAKFVTMMLPRTIAQLQDFFFPVVMDIYHRWQSIQNRLNIQSKLFFNHFFSSSD